MVDLIILKKIQNRSVRNLAFIIRAGEIEQLSLPIAHKLPDSPAVISRIL